MTCRHHGPPTRHTSPRRTSAKRIGDFATRATPAWPRQVSNRSNTEVPTAGGREACRSYALTTDSSGSVSSGRRLLAANIHSNVRSSVLVGSSSVVGDDHKSHSSQRWSCAICAGVSAERKTINALVRLRSRRLTRRRRSVTGLGPPYRLHTFVSRYDTTSADSAASTWRLVSADVRAAETRAFAARHAGRRGNDDRERPDSKRALRRTPCPIALRHGRKARAADTSIAATETRGHPRP